MDKPTVIAVCVIVVGAVLCVALMKDIDGAVLGAGLGTIGTLAGYLFGMYRKETPSISTAENNHMQPSDTLDTRLSYNHVLMCVHS